MAGLLIGATLLAACQGSQGPGSASNPCPTAAPVAAASVTSPGPTATDSGSPASNEGSPAPTQLIVEDVLADVGPITVDTTLGAFTIELETDIAPVASANFVALARCGFYDGLTFHRVLTGFVAQAGDPNTRENQGDFEGIGTGGPGYGFPIELPPDGVNYDAYTVAMANTGRPDSNGSQFFICLSDIDERLPTRTYTIFGHVTDGTDVVDAIGAVEVNDPLIGIPVDPVVINRIDVASTAESGS